MGVALFALVSKDKQLHTTFAAGFSLNNNWRLQEEMLKIFEELNRKPEPVNPPVIKKKTDAETQVAEILQTAQAIQSLVTNANPELHQLCLDKAKTSYKKVMNDRAVVFYMVPSDMYDNPNRPDLVAARRQLCLDVVRGYQEASKLYDEADNVKLYGQLEDAEITAQNSYDDIPDILVNKELNNARKNLSKINGKEKTPGRVIKKQILEQKIKILSERWLSLQRNQ